MHPWWDNPIWRNPIGGIIDLILPVVGDTSDDAVNDLTNGLPNETDARGRPQRGNYVDEKGNPEDALNELPGEVGENGQKTLPDGSVAGEHKSTTTGHRTLHIRRPKGKQDIKIRFPNCEG